MKLFCLSVSFSIDRAVSVSIESAVGVAAEDKPVAKSLRRSRRLRGLSVRVHVLYHVTPTPHDV